MNQSDFLFDTPAWELALDALKDGSTLSAARFLSLMEAEPEEALEDAFNLLDRRDILLDISDLPRPETDPATRLRLQREEELAASGQLPDGLAENDPLRLYLEEIARIPSYADPDILAMSCLAGDEGARKTLADHMLSLVFQRACECMGHGVLLLDLIQEGSLGLWQAILEYSGGDITACCDRGIRKMLAKLVIRQSRSLGVVEKMRASAERYRAEDLRLLSRLGRNPTVEEIALNLHMTQEEAEAVADAMESAALLNRAQSPKPPEETPEDAQRPVEDTAYFRARERISEMLSGLSETDARLISLRFGLENGPPQSPEQVGALLGLTPEEVIGREKAALEKLRKQG